MVTKSGTGFVLGKSEVWGEEEKGLTEVKYEILGGKAYIQFLHFIDSSKNYQMFLNICNLFYNNYTSIKLLQRKNETNNLK